MHLVRRLPASRQVQADPRRPCGAVQLAVIYAMRTARMIRTVISHIPSAETVQLVSTVEMHPANLHRIVTRRA